MSALNWNHLVGQEYVKSIIGAAFQRGVLGHAYLFSGQRGAGKFAAALDIAMALLCKEEGVRPCGECLSCKKVKAYSHPDFHVVMPLALEDKHKKNSELNEKGWQYIGTEVKNRIDEPYKLLQYEKKPDIPVDLIREANDAVMRGATEGAFNVVIIDGADTLKKESANAMLKTLEEPPKGTVMILLTDKIHAVLSTIVSRCQLVRFAPLPPDVIASEVARRFNADVNDERVISAALKQSLGVAIDEFENPRDEYFKAAANLWNDCANGDWESATEYAESLSASKKDAYSECNQILSCIVELLRFAILKRHGAEINYFDLGESITLPQNIEPQDVESYIALCEDAMFAITKHGNAMLVMINFVCTLMEMLNVKKQ